MNTLELHLLHHLNLPEHHALLFGARQHQPTFLSKGEGRISEQEMRTLLRAIHSAGGHLQEGICLVLGLPAAPQTLSGPLLNWLQDTVLPHREAHHNACAVSLNPRSGQAVIIVVLLAQLA